MVDSAGPKKKAGPGARKRRRVALKIDMTPMVDIAFLLVIFFMTTTRFREPQAIEITLPKLGKPKKTKQSNVLVLAIDNQGKLAYTISGAEPMPVELDSLDALLRVKERENILKQPSGTEQLKRYDFYDSMVVQHPGRRELLDSLLSIKNTVSQLTVLIQVDPRSRYKAVIDAMDAVNFAHMARFSVIRAGSLEQSPTPGTPGTPGTPAPPAAPAPPGPTGMVPLRSQPTATRELRTADWGAQC
jgi:biopolymer transport protein ExbD